MIIANNYGALRDTVLSPWAILTYLSLKTTLWGRQYCKSLYYRWRNWGIRRLSNWSKDMQLRSNPWQFSSWAILHHHLWSIYYSVTHAREMLFILSQAGAVISHKCAFQPHSVVRSCYWGSRGRGGAGAHARLWFSFLLLQGKKGISILSSLGKLGHSLPSLCSGSLWSFHLGRLPPCPDCFC